MFDRGMLERQTVNPDCSGQTIREALTQTAVGIEGAKTDGRLDLLPALFDRLDRLVLELYSIDLGLLDSLSATITGSSEG